MLQAGVQEYFQIEGTEVREVRWVRGRKGLGKNEEYGWVRLDYSNDIPRFSPLL